jgi:hypothetical protein
LAVTEIIAVEKVEGGRRVSHSRACLGDGQRRSGIGLQIGEILRNGLWPAELPGECPCGCSRGIDDPGRHVEWSLLRIVEDGERL